MPTQPASDQRHAPLQLWRAASGLITTLFNLFGAPEKLAAKHTLTAEARALILSWLRCAEAMVRHLLLIEASHCAHEPLRVTHRRAQPRVRKLVTSDVDQPDSWRVSFRCILDRRRAPNAQALAHRAGKGAGGPRYFSAWPLAERFEALLRAHNNPAPYAKRLARKLYAAPRLVISVLKKPLELLHRIAEETFTQLRDLSHTRAAVFDTG